MIQINKKKQKSTKKRNARKKKREEKEKVMKGNWENERWNEKEKRRK